MRPANLAFRPTREATRRHRDPPETLSFVSPQIFFLWQAWCSLLHDPMRRRASGEGAPSSRAEVETTTDPCARAKDVLIVFLLLACAALLREIVLSPQQLSSRATPELAAASVSPAQPPAAEEPLPKVALRGAAPDPADEHGYRGSKDTASWVDSSSTAC